MPSKPTFKTCTPADTAACLAIFDANCPEYFAPNERADYARFLADLPEGYEVCEVAGSVVAAFGLLAAEGASSRLVWIMIDPRAQGHGLGRAIMQRIMAMPAATAAGCIDIAASQMSEPFFARFGAVATERTEDGWGPGMDRVDMQLAVSDPAAG